MTGRPATPRLESLLSEARWLEGLARALVADRDEAEELVQEVWLAAARRPPEGVQRPRAWLASVLHNALRMRRRAAGARAERERGVARPEAIPSTADAHAAVARAEAQGLLVESVLALDEPGRSTVILRYFDGLASAEIARRQGVPDSTVRNRLSDALARLRERLERTHGREALRGLVLLVPREGSAPAALTTTMAGGVGMAATGKLVAGALVALAVVAWWSLRATESQERAPVETAEVATGALALPSSTEPAAAGAQRIELEPGQVPAPTPDEEARPAPPPPGVLEGLVLDDGELCLRPGSVELAPGWRAEIEGDGPPDMLLTPLDGGHFRFAGLSAGRYGVRLTLEGRRALGASVVLGEEKGATLVLEVGSATLSGHVWEEQGLPVAGARFVIAHKSTAGGGTMPLEHSRAESDALGAFAFTGLSAGAFVGHVELPQGEKVHLTATLTVGEHATLDIGLQRPWPRWRGTLRTRSGAEHRGGAAFELRAASGNPALVSRRAADDGAFDLRLVPGHYRVALQLGEHESFRDVGEIEIGADDLEQDLVLPGARLLGRVRRAGSEGPFPQSLMISVRLEGHDYSAARHGAKVDTAGNYAIDALEPGTYLVNAHPLPLVGGRDATRVEVRAGEDEVQLDLVVTLP